MSHQSHLWGFEEGSIGLEAARSCEDAAGTLPALNAPMRLSGVGIQGTPMNGAPAGRASRMGGGGLARAEARVARVMIADEHEITRVAIASWLGTDRGLSLVGSVSDAMDLTDEVARTKPEVVVVCAERPGERLIEAAAGLRKRARAPRVVVLSAEHSARSCAAARECGGVHVTRADRAPRVLQLLRSLADDESAIGACVAERDGGDANAKLSRRERQVVALLARGLSAKQAAGQLSISAKTVDNHLQRLMRKLDIHSRADLVLFAVREGFVEV